MCAHQSARARRSVSLKGAHSCRCFATTTNVPPVITSGPTNGRLNVMTIARTAVRVTSHRTTAKMWRRATMDSLANLTKPQRIRLLNDHLRTSFTGGKVMLTAGVDALPAAAKSAVLAKVQGFKAFSADNDPHREHDFGN